MEVRLRFFSFIKEKELELSIEGCLEFCRYKKLVSLIMK
jgi:hypothetical protein